MHHRRFWLTVFWWMISAGAGFAPALLRAGESKSVFPAVFSDLPSDPEIRGGELPNGFRYAIMKNDEPKGRITLRFVVGVGSLHESDNERGLAHFVEHMVFRGTRTHPNGTLISELQKRGISFGADVSAFTLPDYTIYYLELPDLKEETLRLGLNVFREFAEEAILDPKALEVERGVVISEKETRDNVHTREHLLNQEFLWPESRYARRPVIGTVETIRGVTREQMASFYDAWYRPERMAVVVVGNVDPDLADRLVHDVYGSMAARAEARPDPTDMVPQKTGLQHVKVLTDPADVGITLTFQHARSVQLSCPTREERIAEMHRSLAFAMFQRRLQRIARDPSNPLTSSASVYAPFRGWQVAAFSAAGRGDQWKQLSFQVEQEHRRALQYGFTPSELELTRKEFAASLDIAVRTAKSRPSDWLANQIAGAVIYGHPLPAPSAVSEDFREPLAATTLSECLRRFREAWETGVLHVFVTANPAIRVSELEVATVLNESRKVAVPKPEQVDVVAFAYENFGEPGKVVSEKWHEDIDVHLAAFENGVRLNFKSTQFDKNWVYFLVRVGHGRLALPEDHPGLPLLAEFTALEGGLVKHPVSEIRDILAGHAVQFHFHVDDDAYLFSGYTAVADLPVAMKLLAAYCSDARFNSNSMRNAGATYNSAWANLEAAPGGPIQIMGERLLYKDRRYGVPGRKEFFDTQFGEVSLYVQDDVNRGPIEMAFTGDVSWPVCLAAAAESFGALPKRAARRDVAEKSRPKLGPGPAKPYVFRTPARLKQTALAWYWPAPGARGIKQERRCKLLAEVLSERMRVRLREELGATYAPSATFVSRDALPEGSYFVVYAEVDRHKAKQAAEVVTKEIEAIRRRGLTEEEFTRIKIPFLRQREDQVRTNEYWCFTALREAQRKPELLEAVRNRERDTAAITRGELNQLAERYLVRKDAYFFVSEPEPVQEWKK